MLPLLRFLIVPCASCLDHGQQDQLRARELQLAGSETSSLRSPWLSEQVPRSGMDAEAAVVHRCALPQRVPQVSGPEGLAPPGTSG